MKEHPIIFSIEMVQAILRGEKTQTRRIITPQPKLEDDQSFSKPEGFVDDLGYLTINQKREFYSSITKNNFLIVSQYRKKSKYNIGDQLWVRESFGKDFFGKIYYKADDLYVPVGSKAKWKPSIHMPRSVSRIQLEIVNIEVERLQDITEEDAKAEGVKQIEEDGKVYHDYMIFKEGPYRLAFAMLWDELNFKRGFGWKENHFVWIIEFKRIK